MSISGQAETTKNGSLAGMPTILLLVAEDDYLRPLGEEYAKLLSEAETPQEFAPGIFTRRYHFTCEDIAG